MRALRVPGLFLIAAAFYAVVTVSAAGRGPQISSSQQTINATWHRTRQACLAGVCTYTTTYQQPMLIYAQYGRHGADDFEVGFDPDRFTGNGPSPAGKGYWRFLTGLLPSGARRVGCRHIAKTGGGDGPANACLYQTKLGRVLVAQYLTPNGELAIGKTARNQGYDSIEAAQRSENGQTRHCVNTSRAGLRSDPVYRCLPLKLLRALEDTR